MSPSRPPAAARWLLRRVLPWSPRSDAILGDLEEEFRGRLHDRLKFLVAFSALPSQESGISS